VLILQEVYVLQLYKNAGIVIDADKLSSNDPAVDPDQSTVPPVIGVYVPEEALKV
jgi:hypothetical protein